MKYFFLRLTAPRPTFVEDMTDSEAALMREHGAYLAAFAEKGLVIAFGPVADPKGPWGMGLFAVEEETDVRVIMENDPTIRSGIGFSYEIFPMPRLIQGGKA